MTKLTSVSLVAQTRVENGADSDSQLRIFSDHQQIGIFDNPLPEQGKMGFNTMTVDLDYEDFIDSPIFLGLTGQDKWAPRSVFLWGTIEEAGTSRIVPLAENFWHHPKSWISQNTGNNRFDRWPLTAIRESDIDVPLQDLVIYMETSDKTYSGSKGPFEFSIFGGIQGLPLLCYQTTLAPLGKQEPTALGAHYLARLQINAGTQYVPSKLLSAQLTNRSDDAWRGKRILLFGINRAGTKGRLLGRKGGTGWVSQDPHDDPDMPVRAFMTASFQLS